jgi:hypothetical protein
MKERERRDSVKKGHVYMCVCVCVRERVERSVLCVGCVLGVCCEKATVERQIETSVIDCTRDVASGRNTDNDSVADT